MTTTKPTITIKYQNDDLKVLRLIGEPGDILPDHKVNHKAILHLLDGSVEYIEQERTVALQKGDFQLIPEDVVHQLSFKTASELELILIAKSQIKFI